MTNVVVTSQFLEFLCAKVTELADDAGYNGEMHDRGASALDKQITCYVHGMNMELPEIWKLYYDEFTKLNDPEYAEYQRLQKKFGK